MSRFGRTLPLLTGTALAGSCLGYGICVAGSVLPSASAAWLAFAAASLVTGGVVSVLAGRLWFAPGRAIAAELDELRGQAAENQALRQDLSSRLEQQRRLRHDLRGALSPVLLVADRLGAHPDPAVKRSGDIMLRTVERATTLLEEPSPPAGP